MKGCGICDGLLLQYLLASETLREARRELAFAFTQLQMECAQTRLSRVEAHKEYTLKELREHCQRSGCEFPEVTYTAKHAGAPAFVS